MLPLSQYEMTFWLFFCFPEMMNRHKSLNNSLFIMLTFSKVLTVERRLDGANNSFLFSFIKCFKDLDALDFDCSGFFCTFNWNYGGRLIILVPIRKESESLLYWSISINWKLKSYSCSILKGTKTCFCTVLANGHVENLITIFYCLINSNRDKVIGLPCCLPLLPW